MTDLLPPDYAHMEKVAQEATQGTWYRSGGRNDLYDGKTPVNGHGISVEGSQICIAHVFFDKSTGEGFSDANHIATFDPPTVLALLADLARKTEALEEGERRLTQCLGMIVEFGNLNGFRNLSDQELGRSVLAMATAASATLDNLRAALAHEGE